MTFARRKDSTHREVIQAFTWLGFTVCDTSRAPYCPDLFVAKAGRTIAVEVKAKGGKRTDQQSNFARDWAGDYALVTSAEQVIKEYGR